MFRTDSRDDIVFVRAGTSQAGYFNNVDRTRRQGLELAAQGRTPGWEWHASYTLLDATYQSQGVLPGPLSTQAQPNAFAPGTRIAGLPRHVLKVGADWRVLPQLTLGADVQAAGSQPLAGNESGTRSELGRVAGHAVVHVRARWEPAERWRVSLRVQNLFDRRYATFGTANLDLFPGGVPLQPGGDPAGARFLAPSAWLYATSGIAEQGQSVSFAAGDPLGASRHAAPRASGMNHKRVYRLYNEANLAVRRRKKVRRPGSERVPLKLAQNVNEVWSMDFYGPPANRKLELVALDDSRFSTGLWRALLKCPGPA